MQAFGRMGMGVGLGRLGSRRPLPFVPNPDWTPAALGDKLIAWWDAEDPASLSLTGGLVNSWTDKKNGIVVSQALSGSKPVYSATSYGGRPGLTFDGVDDQLTATTGLGALPVGDVKGEHWAVLSAPTGSNPAVRVAANYGGAVSSSRIGIQRSISSEIPRIQMTYGYGTSQATSAALDIPDRNVTRCQALPEGTMVTEVDGIHGAVTATPRVGAIEAARVRIGAASNTAATLYWLGQISVYIITTTLTDAEAFQLRAWMARRQQPWTPLELGSKLVAWFDAEAPTSFFETSGALVTSWFDRKAGLRVAQSLSSLKPSLNPTALNGRPALVFDGTDDYLIANPTAPAFATAQREYWALTSQDAPTDDAGVRTIARHGGATTTRIRYGKTRASSANRARMSATTTPSGEPLANELTKAFDGIHVTRGVVTATGVRVEIDKAVSSTAAITPNMSNTTFNVGAENSTTGFWLGKMNSVILTEPLTGAEAALVWAFLGARGGLAL